MHFEFLIEDQSGKRALEILLPQILDESHTFRIHSYKGVGRIPPNLKPKSGAEKRILLDQLPRLLKGFGRALKNQEATVLVVCDLDNKDKNEFHRELTEILDSCDPKPNARFCFAIEELEAWYLGDIPAIRSAYPSAKTDILNKYENDSICGTWELLADTIYPNGREALSKKGWQAIGEEKSVWAVKISPQMDVGNNLSPSFRRFRSHLMTFRKQ
jgi:hypothetical protein